MKFAVSLAALFIAGTASANPGLRGDPRAAESIVNQVCAACHAADGNSAAAANPRLAGLNAEYIYKQLTDYKSGARKNAVMAGMVANLTDDDKRNLAVYFANQRPKPATSKNQELALVGERIWRGGVPGTGVPACASCHGVRGQGIPTQFPRLAGQHSDYIYTQLNEFRLGNRANDAAQMMRNIAARMTDADMRAVSAYVQGLR